MRFLILHREYERGIKSVDSLSGLDFVLTTYDTLITLGKRSRLSKKQDVNIFDIQWHRIIADESQRFVNPKAKLFKALSSFHPCFRLCLTGTPIRNYDYDLYSQLLFCGLDKGIKWSYKGYMEMGLSRNIMLMSMDDAEIQLPTKHTVRLNLKFNPEEREIYDSVLERSRDTLQTFSDGKTTFAAVLIQFLRLRQVCITSDLILKKQDSKTESTKFGRVLQIVKHVPVNEKVLIFSCFTSALSILMNLLTDHSYPCILIDGSTSMKKRDKLLNMFRTSNTHNILLLTNTVGSVGLNLIEANHVILLEPWWNTVTGNQAAARCHRIGQKRDCYVWELVMKNSVEERMVEMCNTKSLISNKFLNKDILNMFLK